MAPSQRQRLSSDSQIAEKEHWAAVPLRIGSLVAGLYLTERIVGRFARQAASRREGGSMVESIASTLVTLDPASLAIGTFVIVGCVVAIARRSLGPTWSDLGLEGRARLFLLVVAAILSWFFATSDFDHFGGNLNAIDRMLLIALVPMIWHRPAFIVPHLLLAWSTMLSVDVPIGGASWSEPVMLIRILALVPAYAVVGVGLKLWWKKPRPPNGADLVFTVCCLIAAHYWVAGYGKLELGWLGQDHIQYLLPATYAGGWLSFLDAETIASVTRGVAVFNLPLKLFTLLIEVGILLMVMRRGTVRFFLAGAIALHLGIVAMSGIFFWRWILVDGALLLLLFGPGAPALRIFSPTHRIVSVILIAGGSLWFGPVKLAWYDVPAVYSYRLFADGSDGNEYRLPPRSMAPYHYHFTLAAFGYLDDGRLQMAFGATGRRNIAEALADAGSPEEALAVEQALGDSRRDEARTARLRHFLERYWRDWNQRRIRDPRFDAKEPWWRWLKAPSQLLTFPRHAAIPEGVTVERIRVRQVFAFFDDRDYHEIRDREVLSIEIPSESLEAPTE